jgi:Protein of unknown function (DUF2384)
MPLQPNGAGLTEDTVAHLNAPTSQRVQHIEGFGVAGLASGPTFHVPPKQAASFNSGAIDAFVKTCQRWHLSSEQQIILLGYSGSEFLGRELLEGRLVAPPQDVRERAGYILAISVGLASLFDDSERAELAWLNAPRDALNGSSPLAYMLEGRMANLMYVAAMVACERGM